MSQQRTRFEEVTDDGPGFRDGSSVVSPATEPVECTPVDCMRLRGCTAPDGCSTGWIPIGFATAMVRRTRFDIVNGVVFPCWFGAERTRESRSIPDRRVGSTTMVHPPTTPRRGRRR